MNCEYCGAPLEYEVNSCTHCGAPCKFVIRPAAAAESQQESSGAAKDNASKADSSKSEVKKMGEVNVEFLKKNQADDSSNATTAWISIAVVVVIIIICIGSC